MNNMRIFLSENFHFLVVNFSMYLNRHVFIMPNYQSLLLIIHVLKLEAISLLPVDVSKHR